MEHVNHGLVAFDGLENTRDLGGMRTADGRRIKGRRLLRSGRLAPASEDDLRRLRDDYDLRLDVDLRTDEELAEAPDPVSELPSTRFVHLPVFQDLGAGVSRSYDDLERVRSLVLAGKADAGEIMVALYPHIVLDDMGIAAYRTFFEEVLACREGCVLWHCTAGKDRCGMASVLMETALGIPEATVRADYLATNKVLGIDPATCTGWEIMEGVSERFLDAALRAINENYGNIDNYLARALGVDEAERAELAARYLED